MWILLAQKVFGQNPAFVRWKHFGTDQSHAAPLIMAAYSFAGAGPANAAANDEIVALNHMRKCTIISAPVRRQVKSLRWVRFLGWVDILIALWKFLSPDCARHE